MLLNKTCNLLKKKFSLLCLFCVCFMLQEVRDNLVNYVTFASNYDEAQATKLEKQKFVKVDAFFERLANQLFFEKHDSELVKELFLASKPPYTDLIGCLYLGYYGEYLGVKKYYIFETVFLLKLNLYRLGFIDFCDIRLLFWGFRNQLNIKSEHDYKIALEKAISEYCVFNKCDEHDKQVFYDLLNYTYSERFLHFTKWA